MEFCIKPPRRRREKKRTATTATKRVIDNCDLVSDFRKISVSSLVFQMKRLAEKMVWLSLSTPLTSLS
jgi:hypothetical protein